MQTMTTLGDVEPYQQITNYSCGAATLKAVFKHWGDDVDEPVLMREIGVSPKSGSTAFQVARAARRRSYLAQEKQFTSIDELAEYTNQDVPVIIAIRSFKTPNQGHFVVATKVRGMNGPIEIMDPNVRGNRRTVSRAELDSRWQFRDRVGVVVVPRRAKTQSQFGAAMTTRQKSWLLGAAIGFAVSVAAVGGVIYWRRRSR